METTTTDPAREQATAQDRYEHLKSEREPYLNRAREAARYTLPALVPEEGDQSSQELHQNFQSLGSRGTNHLAAKLLLALFPAGRPFFRLTIDEYVEDALEVEAGSQAFDEAKQEFRTALARVERSVMTRLEQTGARSTLNEVLKHLLVAGNVLVQVLKDGSLKLHPLSAYVVKRDKEGSILEIIVKETVARMALPKEALEVLEVAELNENPDEDAKNNIDLFTRIRREDDGSWTIAQEVKGHEIESTKGDYPEDKSAWIPLRFIKVDGEDYGRGFVEQYIGDLRSAEALNKAVVMFAAAAAKILIFVDDNGYVTVKQVSDAESGDVLPGDADHLSVFQLDKQADFAVADELLQRIENRLEQAFLLFSGIQRDAERVTAEEIRAMIQELEQGLGGVYSVLAQELQVPLVNRVIHMMQKAEDLPRLPEGAVNPEIVTGVEALGRQSDAQKRDRLLADLGALFGPEAVAQEINIGVYVQQKANDLSLDIEGLVKTEEQKAQERQAAIEAQVATQVAPEAAKQRLQNDEGGA